MYDAVVNSMASFCACTNVNARFAALIKGGERSERMSGTAVGAAGAKGDAKLQFASRHSHTCAGHHVDAKHEVTQIGSVSHGQLP